MSIDTFIGEVKMFAGNFPPRDWAFCDGQILSINENQELFSLLGTAYGGDGRVTFALPDLRGRMPLHVGASMGPGLSRYREGQHGGAEAVKLTETELPPHSHRVTIKASPSGSAVSGDNVANGEGDESNSRDVEVTTDSVGDNQPHNNMPPYTAINFIICLRGAAYPPRS